MMYKYILRITLIIISFSFIITTNAQELIKSVKVDSISIFFDFGSSKIDNQKSYIDRLNKLSVNKTMYIKLNALTDTVGSITFNKNLASKRLLAVTLLIKKTKLSALQIDSTNSNEQKSKNSDSLFRRVDLIVYKIEPQYKLNEPVPLLLNFHPSTDRLIGGDKNISLDQIALILKMDTSLTIKLNGHVCCIPDQEMSLNRAIRVKKYLIKRGIVENRISCEGFSNSKPLFPEINEVNRDKNKRVDVIFIKQ